MGCTPCRCGRAAQLLASAGDLLTAWCGSQLPPALLAVGLGGQYYKCTHAAPGQPTHQQQPADCVARCNVEVAREVHPADHHHDKCKHHFGTREGWLGTHQQDGQDTPRGQLLHSQADALGQIGLQADHGPGLSFRPHGSWCRRMQWGEGALWGNHAARPLPTPIAKGAATTAAAAHKAKKKPEPSPACRTAEAAAANIWHCRDHWLRSSGRPPRLGAG